MTYADTMSRVFRGSIYSTSAFDQGLRFDLVHKSRATGKWDLEVIKSWCAHATASWCTEPVKETSAQHSTVQQHLTEGTLYFQVLCPRTPKRPSVIPWYPFLSAIKS